MAVKTLSTSRRAMLGAIAVTPVALTVAVSAAPMAERLRWDAAVTALRRAEAEAAHHDKVIYTSLEKEAVRKFGPEPWRDPAYSDWSKISGMAAAGDRADELEIVVQRRINDLVHLPPPDIASLADKIDLIIRGSDDLGEHLEILARDARTFA